MKIDRISKTRRGRFALFSEDEFLFSVDAETLAKYGLGDGSSLDDEELLFLKQQSDTRKAKDSALRFLSLRAYAEKELFDKLCVKYDEHTAAAAVASMVELELLDDETFATEKAKGMAERGKSGLEIRRKLSETGIQRDMIDLVMQRVELDDVANAVALLEKMYIEKLRRGEKQKVMAALARRGFSHRDIKEALEQIGPQEDEDGEYE